MRQTAAAANRVGLAVLGVLLLLAGGYGVLAGTGLLLPWASALGLRLDRPTPTNRLFGSTTTGALAQTWGVLLVALVGLVLALLALSWLVAQVPRTNAAATFRLQDDPSTGLTRVSPKVLTDAVETQTRTLPGVESASAVLRGTTTAPDLTLKVTASDRIDLPALLERIRTQVAGDLAEALDVRLGRLGVQVEVAATRTSQGSIDL